MAPRRQDRNRNSQAETRLRRRQAACRSVHPPTLTRRHHHIPGTGSACRASHSTRAQSCTAPTRPAASCTLAAATDWSPAGSCMCRTASAVDDATARSPIAAPGSACAGSGSATAAQTGTARTTTMTRRLSGARRVTRRTFILRKTPRSRSTRMGAAAGSAGRCRLRTAGRSTRMPLHAR